MALGRTDKALKVTSISLLISRAYLVEHDNGVILVDAGMPGEERRILRKINANGYDDLSLVYITHAHIDHYGSAAALREITGAPIAVHSEDSEAMSLGETRLGTAKGSGRLVEFMFPIIQRLWHTPSTPADIVLEDGDDLSHLGMKARVLHTPGHTLGSSCLLVEDVAFVGDLVTSTGRHPRMQRYYAESWPLLETSIMRLMDADPQLAYPGHGRIPLGIGELRKLALK
jgi:glyoxylase-like metal-dependent hydrolase (beta-lactamase superfamily II)